MSRRHFVRGLQVIHEIGGLGIPLNHTFPDDGISIVVLNIDSVDIWLPFEECTVLWERNERYSASRAIEVFASTRLTRVEFRLFPSHSVMS